MYPLITIATFLICPRFSWHRSEEVNHLQKHNIISKLWQSSDIIFVSFLECQVSIGRLGRGRHLDSVEAFVMPIPSNGGCSQTSVATRKKRKEERSQATIRQHYYPESGWGWVVVTVAFLVQVITHGFQMSYGVTLLAILKRWGPSRYMEAGREKDALILLGTITSLWNTWLYTWYKLGGVLSEDQGINYISVFQFAVFSIIRYIQNWVS